MPLMTFEDALKDSSNCKKRHLLLGNGFSIACRPDIFVYKRLFEQADFSKLSTTSKDVFEHLGTQDFEKVIKILRESSVALKAYQDAPKKLRDALQKDADGLRELLVQTIAQSHPEQPSDISDNEFTSCRRFLSNFNNIYTLNYDLLLYWTLMHVDEITKVNADDGFRKPENNDFSSYVTWDSSNTYDQNIYYLHGALHLFDSDIEIKKFTWSNTGVRLIQQIRDALNSDLFPIFVSEGTSDEKLAKIRHNDYLSRAYKSFTAIQSALFIHGHSLAPNDEHILKRIERNKVSNVYVGIYGDPSSAENKRIISRAKLLNKADRKTFLDVKFYDTETANVWGSLSN